MIGLISDTHGLMRESALKALRGVDRILHAGDVGTPDVLDRLRVIAPVNAVAGNVDAPDSGLPASFETELLGQRNKLDDLAPTRMMKGYDRIPPLYADPASVQPGSISGFRFDRIYFCSHALKQEAEQAGFKVNHADVFGIAGIIVHADVFGNASAHGSGYGGGVKQEIPF